MTETTKKIACVRCEREFETFAPGQAHECASDIKGRQVHGHYGSAVLDLESARFRDGEDHGFPEGQICDGCITELLDQGLLIHEGSRL